jgi:hypothetical protein
MGPSAIRVRGGRWSGASPGSARLGAALRAARGGPSAQAPRQRGGGPERPRVAEACPRRQRPGWGRGRRDETARKGAGPGEALERAVEQTGQTRDVRRPAPRAAPAAQRGLPKASRRPGVPAPRPSAGRAAPAAALKSAHEEPGPASAIRQVTELNHRGAQAQRGGPRRPRPRGGGPALAAAPATRRGLALRPRPRLQPRPLGGAAGHEGRTAAAPCAVLAADASPQTGATAPAGPPEQNLRQNR